MFPVVVFWGIITVALISGSIMIVVIWTVPPWVKCISSFLFSVVAVSFRIRNIIFFICIIFVWISVLLNKCFFFLKSSFGSFYFFFSKSPVSDWYLFDILFPIQMKLPFLKFRAWSFYLEIVQFLCHWYQNCLENVSVY